MNKKEFESFYENVANNRIDYDKAIKRIKELLETPKESNPISLKQPLGNDMVTEVYKYNEPFLKDHIVNDKQVILGVAHGSLAINAFFKLYPEEKQVNLKKLNFIKAIEVDKGQHVEVMIRLIRDGSLTRFKSVYRGTKQEKWSVSAEGNLKKVNFKENRIDLRALKISLEKLDDFNYIYSYNPILRLGESFRTINHLYKGKDRVLAEVKLNHTAKEEMHKYYLHPLIINSAFLSVFPLLEDVSFRNAFLPFGIKNVLFEKGSDLKNCWVYAKIVNRSEEIVVFDSEVISGDNKVIAKLEGCSFKRIRNGLYQEKNKKTKAVKNELIEGLHKDSSNLFINKADMASNLYNEIMLYLKQKISKAVNDPKKLDEINTNIMDMGMESSKLVETAGEIEKELRIELYPTLFFEYPNIKELSEYFFSTYEDKFSNYFNEKKGNYIRPQSIKKSFEMMNAESFEMMNAEYKDNIKKEQSIISESIENSTDDIAVIGMHGLFGESENLDQFWTNLISKKDLIKEIPSNHWDYKPWFDKNPLAKDKTYCKWGSFIDDVDKFDAGFFNISPKEAEWMDPQLRLLLQSIYATGEDAGYINKLRGTNTGVFVGACFHDYADLIAEKNLPVDPYIGTGNAQTVLANRVSFTYNFTGPSITFDTACSSSLFALHAACNALKSRECQMAFVGGVNLLLSSFHYRYFSSIGALSASGRCHTFDKEADGYVPGECIASILLKPLKQAEKDNDRIYAVIKGTAALHGGYTPSLTAPSVKGEENVILKAWAAAGIQPDTISYIEAHGTGTKLGDPIEIKSLTKAFKRFTEKKRFCAIGSVKGNIGHTEGAAGIAGILKIILQIKNRKIPALPKFKNLNPYIDLEDSALYINRDIEDWKGREGLPMRAGINSFGFSGAYAHAVIEEYKSSEKAAKFRNKSDKPVIIVLSAKNDTILRLQANRLLDMLNSKEFKDSDLPDIAYTLQTGREAMEERMALLVFTIKDLIEKLNRFVQKENEIEGLYHGYIEKDKKALPLLDYDEDMEKMVDTWVVKDKYDKLIKLWVKGINFNWNKLYGNIKPERITLPTYPFVKERYWIPEINYRSGNNFVFRDNDPIHPLLQKNTSNLNELRFSSSFNGSEELFTNNVLEKEKILLWPAYLEMALAAIERVGKAADKEERAIQIKNVNWYENLKVYDHEATVNIALVPNDDKTIDFEIYDEYLKDKDENRVYCQGTADQRGETWIEPLNLSELRVQYVKKTLNAEQDDIGIKSKDSVRNYNYGIFEETYFGEKQVLAKIKMPTPLSNENEPFILNPIFMSSTIYELINLLNDTNSYKQILPSELKQIDIVQNCYPPIWIHVRYSEDDNFDKKLMSLDIEISDKNGKVSIRLLGLTCRIIESDIELRKTLPKIDTIILEPLFKKKQIIENSKTKENSEHLVVLCEPKENLLNAVKTINSEIRFIVLKNQENEKNNWYQICAIKVYETIQDIMKNKKGQKLLVQVVLPIVDKQLPLFGLSGLLKTAMLENPKLKCQIIGLDKEENIDDVIKILRENGSCPQDFEILYKGSRRSVRRWRELETSIKKENIPWKEEGVYLITGGCGGIGSIFAKEISRQVKNPILILAGRSELNSEKEEKIREIKNSGCTVEYIEVDVVKKDDVGHLLKRIKDEYGRLNGIIHCAGIVRDHFILNKSTDEFKKVLAPKIEGVVNLDESSKEFKLDFFILFSSISGVLGNIGQADYATANAFMDYFAKYRNKQVKLKKRMGRTVSINWPLWKDGGMQVNSESIKSIKRNYGITPMGTDNGIKAFYQVLDCGKEQAMVVEGYIYKIKELLLNKNNMDHSKLKIEPELQIERGLNTDKVLHRLKVLLGKIIKLDESKIDSKEPLEIYGIDSIVITRINQELLHIFGDLPKTLFFEYQNLEDLAEYLTKEYPQECNKWIGHKEKIRSESKEIIYDLEVKRSDSKKERTMVSKIVRRNIYLKDLKNHKNEGIAIIGVSGRYPMANDLKTFWKNLENGTDCITEIPEDRWSLKGFYDPNPKEAVLHGKSYCKWGGFIEGFSEFDPMFFNISPREAINMDPQERIFIESCWNLIEDAGYTKKSLKEKYNNRVGVFAGITKTGFDLYGPELWKNGEQIYPRTSFSSVANRISYLFNLKGPSIPIDTMCSSSLTAIHEACEHLLRNECEIAIAGGVNLYLHPSCYISLCLHKMLSTEKHCISFGKGGNGFIPGEGVGTVLLKRLSKAIEDKDQIYAVIRGTAINHGGKTNGYTVPNPIAQSELIRKAIVKAGVNARCVSYIEAHGTGTELGDPIEITGLSQAFKKDTHEKGFCSIGSVKTNIGHLEAAAGIAGITKILLQIKNKKIAPSLHAKELNPNINFDETPFSLQQELSEWKRPVINIDGGKKEYPRIAGISSFGAGGSNAHVIIEEYIMTERKAPIIEIPEKKSFIILLSAKNKMQLKRQAENLLAFIDENKLTDDKLANMAYTLQVGREAMEERLAFIVRTIKELKNKLTDYIDNKIGIEDMYRGQVKSYKDTIAFFDADEDLQKAIDAWILKGKISKLLDLWVKGLIFDWNKLYGVNKPLRMSLPTYPFTKERFWVPIVEGFSNNAINKKYSLHPLLHENTSDLSEQSYCTTFNGEEIFLKDHVIKGEKILPAVIYLEMVRAAIAQSTSYKNLGKISIQIKNVIWAKPIVIKKDPVKVKIILYPESRGMIGYEICNGSENKGKDKNIYSRGVAELNIKKASKKMEISALQKKCNQKIISRKQCYDTFNKLGISYGPGHQGIENIYIGNDMVLAKIMLPSSENDKMNNFVLHPGILDSAFQGIIGLFEKNKYNGILLPFALRKINILGICSSSMWALIRPGGASTFSDNVQSYDIDILNEKGEICFQLSHISFREYEEEISIKAKVSKNQAFMLQPMLKRKDLINERNIIEYKKHLVMIIEPKKDRLCVSKYNNTKMEVEYIQSDQTAIEKRYIEYAGNVVERLKQIIKEKNNGNVLFQVVATAKKEKQLFSGIAGILKTACLENPNIVCQFIELENEFNVKRLETKLKENGNYPEDKFIKYKNGKRWVENFNEVQAYNEEKQKIWKDKGVYLITGGAGGLGLIYSNEIAKKAKQTTLILTGRSALNGEKNEKINRLRSFVKSIEYLQIDITKEQDVFKLIPNILKKYKKLNGIVHGAGVILDNYIINKTKVELEKVLSPKVTGLVNLDRATRNLDLDFIICFSSLAAAFGNPGQSDYAAANAFMDAYARYRKTLVMTGKRKGMTLSINWALWKSGGMHVDEKSREMMAEKYGLAPMETLNGINAFYKACTLNSDRVIVMEGNLIRLREVFLNRKSTNKFIIEKSNAKEVKKLNTEEHDILRDKAIAYFKSQLSSVIKMAVERIEADVPMENYGIDSIMVMEMTERLERIFGLLSKTLFYEYQNIKELVEYFIENFPEKLEKLLELKGDRQDENMEYDNERNIEKSLKNNMIEFRRQRFDPLSIQSLNKERTVSSDIAIIGISGKYPGAGNINEFWENLQEGIDSITEIPSDRWDYRDYFDKDKNKVGKTYSKWGGFIKGIDEFDPLFFNISPKEAEIMDPQERLFLQCVYETLEDAGYTRESLWLNNESKLGGNVGVYVGVMYEEYQLYGVQETIKGRPISLSGNPSSIANRVSYFCNFNGPSMAVDTMCSSSLTTIHLACQSLREGECDMAIAGGVNASIHPNKYLMLGQGKFVSSKGRCESFGMGGDGYVPAEGVGAVLLKPLSKSVADGDHIYGIIKATAINHGGKTNGYTIPNPNAQSAVIKKAFLESEIDPRTISYIEAHGTGTTLGDPIEITGLTNSFKQYTNDEQFCAIGSVKSNIGHCESAAGIAGVTKVLLQFKHNKLVPSLHSNNLNPNINFKNTPFYVQQELTDWKRPKIETGGSVREYPRRAGISSFGAGGSNAHVIIEEYNDKLKGQMNNNNQNSSIILISAKSKKQLKEKVKQILNEIESEKIKNDELIDLAYTLQVGREHMEERLAIVINTINELKNKLRSILCEELESIDVYMDSVRKEKYILNLFKTDKELQDAVEKWIERKKYGKLLELWVKGLNINWDKMYKNTKPKRLSLPTYPFKNERYWIPEYSNNLENNIKTINENKAGTFMLHPLIDKNISTFKVEKFETHLSGKEFYIKDHKVNSENVFPGVAYIEMARAAGEIAGEKKVISMSDMTWIRPLIVDQDGCIAKIYLHPDEEHVSYEVIANRETEKPVKYFEGKLVYGDGKNKTQKFGKIDLIDIKAKCKNNISKESFYKNLENSGLKYGRSFQAINNLFYHNNEALSHLLAPGILDEKFSRFVLHPVLMDGALQTISSLLMRTENESNRMYLPIHIKEIEIFESTPKECYVNVKVIKNINMNDENVKAFSVIIANKKGDILVNMKNVVIKSVKDGLLKRNRSKTSAQIEERKIRSSSISEVLYSLQNGEMKPEQACTLTEDIL